MSPSLLDTFLAVCGQNANRTKCQPDIMPTKGWHFVRTDFCGWHFVRPNFLVGILSGSSQHVLACLAGGSVNFLLLTVVGETLMFFTDKLVGE